MRRCGWLVLIGCLGCQSLLVPPDHGEVAGKETSAPRRADIPVCQATDKNVCPPVESQGLHPAPLPESLGLVGRTLLSANHHEQVGQTSPSALSSIIPATPVTAEDDLKQAALLLSQGQDLKAAEELARYVARRPEHLIARAQLGELLFRQKKIDASRLHFELFVAAAQEHGEEAFNYLIHCHSRLVEIAETQDDAYQEHLNRGIGLYLLACRRAAEPDPNGECSAGSLFCRAASEFQEARREQPGESRPELYLYHVWSHLGQRAAARRALHTADTHALFTRLTPKERRELHVACLSESQAIR